MHPLRNGSQATARPAAKPLTGTPGWFTESGDNNVPSYPGADWFNHVISEFQNALAANGIVFDPSKDDHLKLAFDHVKNMYNTLYEYQNKAPSASLFSDAEGLNTSALPVSLARNKTNASQDRWLLLFGDSHGWGQGAPEWDQFEGMSNFSRHSSYPHNNGFMSRIAKYLRDKLQIRENVHTLGHPQVPSRITSFDVRKNNILDICSTVPLDVSLGHVISESLNLITPTANTISQFFAPVARLDVDAYSVMAYREKAATGLFNNAIITLSLETIDKFTTQGKEYKISLPVDSSYTSSGSEFTQVTDSRGNIIAEYNTVTGEFWLITDPSIISYPEWFKTGSKIYFHGSRDIHKIADMTVEGKIKIITGSGSNPGLTLAKLINDNFTIYFGDYLYYVSLKATTNVPSRVTYVHVKHQENGGTLNLSWTDSVSGGLQLTPFLNTGVLFRKSSNPFQPVFIGDNPIVHLVRQGHVLIAAEKASIGYLSVAIDTSQITSGIDEEVIYRIDWGTKQVGDMYLWSELDPSSLTVNIQTRGVIFDNNKVVNFSMGAHSVGAWIGNASGAGETRDHLADILNYTPVRPSHVIAQIPFVNEYLQQTPINTFKANLLEFTSRLNTHLSGSNNYNFTGTDFLFFTTLRDKRIAFQGVAESAITYDMYSNAARDFCVEHGHAFVDVEKELLRLVSSGRVDYNRLYCDDIHPSDYANEVIFKTLKQDYLDFIC